MSVTLPEEIKDLAELRSSEFDRPAWVIKNTDKLEVTVYLDQITEENKVAMVDGDGWVYFK